MRKTQDSITRLDSRNPRHEINAWFDPVMKKKRLMKETVEKRVHIALSRHMTTVCLSTVKYSLANLCMNIQYKHSI